MGDAAHPAGTAARCLTHARSCVPFIWVLWCLLCFQREICKCFRCAHTPVRPASCTLLHTACQGEQSRGLKSTLCAQSSKEPPSPALLLCWVCPAAPSPPPGLGSASSSESIHIHSCRMEQLGGTSRLRFFQAPAASVSAGRRAAGCREWSFHPQQARSTWLLPAPGWRVHPIPPGSPPLRPRKKGGHSQLVGTAVVELELRADKRSPRLLRLQLQHHTEPVCRAGRSQSVPRGNGGTQGIQPQTL